MRRFFVGPGGVDQPTADRLTRMSLQNFGSVIMRPGAWARLRSVPAPPRDTDAAISRDVATPEQKLDGAQQQPASSTAFDPYCIGLLPTYQREGAEGLRAALNGISSLANLRKMARSQQVALPADLRSDDADPAQVREAMITAVAKRLADRRAAAG